MNEQTRVTTVTERTGDSALRQEAGTAPVYSTATNEVGAAVSGVHGPLRWGPIWAGVFCAATTFVIIELFLFWIGALVIQTHTGYLTQGVGNAWISAIVAIVSFFLGGWAAGSAKVLRGTGSGLMVGYMVWALATVLIIALSAIGLGPVFGSAGYAFNNFMVVSHNVAAGPNPAAFVGTIRDGAGWGFLFMILSLIAAAIGGWLGNHDRPA